MWSNRETRGLYAHLAVPTDNELATGILKLVANALDDVRREPELWSDFERQAVRTPNRAQGARRRPIRGLLLRHRGEAYTRDGAHVLRRGLTLASGLARHSRAPF